MAQRVQGNNAEMSSLNNEVSNMQALYAEQEKAMEEQWASVEATLSKLQSRSFRIRLLNECIIEPSSTSSTSSTA